MSALLTPHMQQDIIMFLGNHNLLELALNKSSDHVSMLVIRFTLDNFKTNLIHHIYFKISHFYILKLKPNLNNGVNEGKIYLKY